MTVQELIDKLSQCEPDMDVHFAYNYGDHARTTVTQTVRSVDDFAPVTWSEYHRANRLLDDEDEEDEKDSKLVVVLS